MNGTDKRISNLQLFFLITGFIQGSIFLITFIDGISGTDSWLVEVFSYLISLPFIFSYLFLMKRFPDKNLIEVNDIIFGAWIGRIISVLYALYFFYIFYINLYVVGEFYTTYLLQDTPPVIIIVLFVFVCAYCVKFGITNIAKLSHFSVFFIIAIIVLTLILLVDKMNFTNFLPVLKKPPEKMFWATHIFTTIPFCNVVPFLVVFPSLKTYQKSGKSVFWATTVGGLTLFVATIRNIAVLGDTLPLDVNSSYRVFRMIDIGGFLNRVELLIAINITLALFVKVCVIYYATIKSTGQILHLHSTNTLLLPLAALAVVIALVAYPSSLEYYESLTKYHVFLVIPFELIFPPVTLLIAILRKKKGKESVQAQSTSAG